MVATGGQPKFYQYFLQTLGFPRVLILKTLRYCARTVPIQRLPPALAVADCPQKTRSLLGSVDQWLGIPSTSRFFRHPEIAWVFSWDLQTTRFEIPWFLGYFSFGIVQPGRCIPKGSSLTARHFEIQGAWKVDGNCQHGPQEPMETWRF